MAGRVKPDAQATKSWANVAGRVIIGSLATIQSLFVAGSWSDCSDHMESEEASGAEEDITAQVGFQAEDMGVVS